MELEVVVFQILAVRKVSPSFAMQNPVHIRTEPETLFLLKVFHLDIAEDYLVPLIEFCMDSHSTFPSLTSPRLRVLLLHSLRRAPLLAGYYTKSLRNHLQ